MGAVKIHGCYNCSLHEFENVLLTRLLDIVAKIPYSVKICLEIEGYVTKHLRRR